MGVNYARLVNIPVQHVLKLMETVPVAAVLLIEWKTTIKTNASVEMGTLTMGQTNKYAKDAINHVQPARIQTHVTHVTSGSKDMESQPFAFQRIWL